MMMMIDDTLSQSIHNLVLFTSEENIAKFQEKAWPYG